jgi:hypothetical protein
VRDQSPGPIFKSLNVSQSFRDVVAAAFAFLFVLSVALAFIGVTYLLFFCSL